MEENKKNPKKQNQEKSLPEQKKVVPEKEKSQTQKTGKKAPKLNFFSRIGTGEERDYLMENLAMLVSSGMDILLAIDAIKAGVRTKQIKDLLDFLKSEIDSGSPIWRALSQTGLLQADLISLVKIGEETGRLTENLKIIVAQQEKNRQFKSKLRSALMYPVFVLVLTLVIGLGIGAFVLPKLTAVFDSLDIELPTITKVIIGIGDFLEKNGLYVIPGILVFLGVMFFFLFVNPSTKKIGETILFNTPVIKKLIQETEVSRLGFILGTLLEAGLPIVTATSSLVESTTFHKYRNFYVFLSKHIEQGGSFQKAFIDYGRTRRLVPIPIQQMMIAAEQSGHLAQTLLNVGHIYEGKVETTTKNLTVLLEPIMLVIVWLGVSLLAIGVILPIYSLVGQFN